MGYYDDDFYGPSKRRREKKSSTLVTALLSSFIGGLIVLLMLPTFMKAGIIEIPQTVIERVTSKNMEATPVSAANQSGKSDNSDVVQAVDQAKDAVVGVINLTKMQNRWSRDTKSVEQGTGTGVVFKKEGKFAYIVTNNHVIAGSTDVEVSLSDKDRVKAEVVGADLFTDLAVLKIDASKVKDVVELGDSDQLQPGQTAIPIGNPLGLSQSVTLGVISATNRSIPVDVDKNGQDDWEINVIQTDAAINPGNSGGALININGELVGINTLKIAQNAVEGLGFAIPINEAKPIIDDLME
ncbi:MAG: trypsin-like peptidase domain-containing protein, partial [Bacilli bacterium]